MTPSGNSGQTPFVFTFLVLFSGIVAVQQLSPLKASRPNIAGKTDQFSEFEKVNSRLWEDPFAAVNRHLSLEPNKPIRNKDREKDKDALISQLSWELYFNYRELKDKDNEEEKKILYLGVLFPGNNYFEDSETRRRRRYTILSGLGSNGYTPSKPDNIGYFFPKNPNSNFSEHYIAFEWLENGDNKILVLWLNETWLNSVSLNEKVNQLDGRIEKAKPLNRLNNLFHGLIALDKEDNNGKIPLSDGISTPDKEVGGGILIKITPANSQFKIIGPVGSGTLKNIIDEIEVSKEDELKAYFLNGLEILSPNATAEEEVLLADNSKKLCKVDKIQEKCKTVTDFFKAHLKKVSFIRVTPTDKQLAGKIWEELSLRCVEGDSNCNKERYNVAYISEWDTFYGRNLPITFNKIFNKDKDKHNPNESGETYFFKYMRGLDGQISAISDPKVSKSKSLSDKHNVVEFGQIEKAEGNNQFDYLRRIGEKLKKIDNDLFQQKREHLNAIGVLGSDIYDKLLVFQALKNDFPRTIFFTTDMDSRFLHKEQFNWTRNLIVGSGFGLQLNSKLQRSIPPFRDSYQTANFLAAQVAVHNFEETGKDTQITQGKMNSWLGPSVFEIGRTKAFNLGFPALLDKTEQVKLINMEISASTVHPIKNPVFHEKNAYLWGIQVGIGVLIFLFLYLVFPRFRNLFNTKRRVLFVITFFSLFAILIYSVLRDINSARGEPFGGFQGVSLWPTESIRFLAAFLSVVLIVRAWSHINANTQQLEQYFIPGSTTLPRKLSWKNKFFKCLWDTLNSKRTIRLLSRTFQIYEWKFLPKKFYTKGSELLEINPRIFWKKFQLLGSNCFRFRRAFFLVIIFFIFGRLLTLQWIPFTPYRGAFSLTFDKILLFGFVIPLFLFLVFFVVDATALCTRFLEELRSKPTKWKKESLNKLLCRNNISDDEVYYFNDWADIKIIAKQSEVIEKVIFYPFYVEFLLIISRSTLFDRWTTPLSLLIIFFVCLALPIILALKLQRAADKNRWKAHEEISRKLLEVKSKNSLNLNSDEKQNEKRLDLNTIEKQLEILKSEIETIKEGAFRPFTQQPVIRGLLVPFSGYGGIVLYEYLVMTI